MRCSNFKDIGKSTSYIRSEALSVHTGKEMYINSGTYTHGLSLSN